MQQRFHDFVLKRVFRNTRTFNLQSTLKVTCNQDLIILFEEESFETQQIF